MTNMPNRKTQDFGICNSCQTSENCIYASQAPKFYCNEYEALSHATSLDAESHIDLIPIDRLKGLCASCSNAASCSLRNTDIGVWHCEEYC